MKCRLVMSCLAIVAMAGCAAIDKKPPEEAVRDRAQQRVAWLMAGELEKSYALASPGYRATHTILQYQKDFGGVVMWKAAVPGEIECLALPGASEPTKCQVKMMITYRARGMGWDQTTAVPETWIRLEDDWYLYTD